MNATSPHIFLSRLMHKIPDGIEGVVSIKTQDGLHGDFDFMVADGVIEYGYHDALSLLDAKYENGKSMTIVLRTKDTIPPFVLFDDGQIEITKVFGWLLSGKKFYPIPADVLMESVLSDPVTGVTSDREPKVDYLLGWEVEGGNP